MLYIPSTQTIILSPSQRYTHPQTGEVYGGTDYDDPAKLAGIGAVPITIQEVASGHLATTWEVVLENGSYFYRPVAEVLDVSGLISGTWGAANEHAMSGMDLNSRSSILWMALDPDCPEWRMTRIVAVLHWWESVWVHYKVVKQAILDGTLSYYDPTVAGECPYSIWQILYEA